MVSQGLGQLAPTLRAIGGANRIDFGKGAPHDLSPLRTFGQFAGIGGIEGGLRAFGHEPLGLCEVDDGAIAVLEKHFPGVRFQRSVSSAGFDWVVQPGRTTRAEA